jgi:hypothetical protein
VHAARLLAGEMPPDLERIVDEAGGHLFPQSAAELSMQCSCPDFGNPCKHLAATFYLLAETFDDDPFRILLWRGRTREQLLGGIGAGKAGDDLAAAPDGDDETDGHGGVDGPGGTGRAPGGGRPVPGIAEALADLIDGHGDGPADGSAEEFWLPPVPLPERMRVVDAAPDQLLRQLPDPPRSLGGPGLARALREVYAALGRSDS